MQFAVSRFATPAGLAVFCLSAFMDFAGFATFVILRILRLSDFAVFDFVLFRASRFFLRFPNSVGSASLRIREFAISRFRDF